MSPYQTPGLVVIILLLALPLWGAAGVLHEFELPEEPGTEERALTLDEALERYGPRIDESLRPRFDALGLSYPPERLTLIGLKEERELELWAYENGQPHRVHSYPVKDASGLPGPKRRRGDFQVPEGIYRLDAFNPNSAYHLSLRVNYPNYFDRRMGKLDGREDLGSNIFIHGGDASRGCLAIGDPAIEELFVLVADVGLRNTRLIIAPHDPRERTIFPIPRGLPEWTNELYQRIELAVADYATTRSVASGSSDAGEIQTAP
ncbi:L,D-transpeptidase family protein [Wenzhouxiangella sp. AB-CW3]|uniref:L,D-transpeptidase family protein n=1 Tax=Wenzhouxiangella sp. AB-CW3 TaxID=2771012 RepID=UPI00168B1640|nr:L,D-transpeptidase family protein [Wenzhouxiangella sp. AB-CW3]QOC21608.1 L,D-transpeptidase family protein [Wenzhouxiangella sp. AB-CW3]